MPGSPGWNILALDRLDPGGLAILECGAAVDLRPDLPAGDLLRIAGRFDAVIAGQAACLDGNFFEAATSLKAVGRLGTGLENIDLAAAGARRVTVVNAPPAYTRAAAEHTFGLILALARHIPQADASVKAGLWSPQRFTGVELAGKTLGVIGVGRVGSRVAQRAAAFEMTVVGHDPYLSEVQIIARGPRPVSAAELYECSDWISLHIPLNPETRAIINSQSLPRMKRGVRIVCTSRGGLIDETALLGALESGQAAGAALDVFESEPPGLSALASHPCVIATPHIAARSQEAHRQASIDLAEELLAALEDRPLRWKII
jgi:D-3-phosphoglycerate dehydrogenase